MARDRDALDQLRIARNCPASWSHMKGSDSVRFCSECRKHVYNLSNLTRDEARALLEDVEGSACVRLYRRGDGTVVTKDCSKPVQIAIRIGSRVSGALAAVGIFGFTIFPGAVMGAVAKPTTELNFRVRNVRMLKQELKETTDPEERRTIKLLIEERHERIKQIGRRLLDHPELLDR